MAEPVRARPVVARRRGFDPPRIIYRGDRPLMGATEAANALGVKQQNLRVLGETESGMKFPPPFQELAMGAVWLKEDILAYRDERRRHPPRPGPRKGWRDEARV